MSEKQWHINADGIITDENGFEVCECWDSDDYKATPQGKYIVKCVNEHDNLVAEVERLRKENMNMRKEINEYSNKLINNITELEVKNNQLKEALKEIYEWADECQHNGDDLPITLNNKILKLIGGERE